MGSKAAEKNHLYRNDPHLVGINVLHLDFPPQELYGQKIKKYRAKMAKMTKNRHF
jgi:hypothetical protein